MDILDMRNLTDRFEELETELQDAYESDETEDKPEFSVWIVENAIGFDAEVEKFNGLKALLEDLADYGGDHQWRGDGYPITLIADEDFEEYAREFAEDIGAISRDASWPLMHIDWSAAADALRAVYSTVEYDGTTYWYR